MAEVFLWETDLIWVSLDYTYDEPTLVQVMAWCHQATSNYLNQSWQRSLPPYGVIRPQWVKRRGYNVTSHWMGAYTKLFVSYWTTLWHTVQGTPLLILKMTINQMHRWKSSRGKKVIITWKSYLFQWAIFSMSEIIFFGTSNQIWLKEICANECSNKPNSCWNHGPANTLRQRRNGQHFANNIFKCIFFNENVSLTFVCKGPINNIPALVQTMDWCC